MGKQNNEYLNFKALAGNNITVDGTSVEVTGLVPGAIYRMSSTELAVFRWDTTAVTAADGGFSGAIARDENINVYCPSTILNVKRGSGNDGILFLQQLESI